MKAPVLQKRQVNKVQSQITEKKKASKGQDKCPAPSCGSATLELLKGRLKKCVADALITSRNCIFASGKHGSAGLWYFQRFYYLEPHTHPLKPRGEDLLQQKTALEAIGKSLK